MGLGRERKARASVSDSEAGQNRGDGCEGDKKSPAN